ncbi:acetate kinase [Rickettsiales bacterium]|nr:acetate kinase [Rickettsiales bacterium]
MNDIIITCNAGSTNTKLAAFDAETLERKGHSTSYHAAETSEWLCSVGSLGTVTAIGHRVVHGGFEFTQPTRITPDVLDKLKSYIPLAPLHQPAAIKMIEEAQKLYPDVPHIACFDTAFHHTMLDIQRRFALPQKFYDEGVVRYGFHGLSYQHIAETMPEHERVVVAHLGGGASACAMKNRQSVASTMGFSTLDGLMMGTRCGAIDAGVLLYLLQEKNMTAEQLSNLLYHESGLKGVSEISGNMQELLANKAPAAKQSVELFCSMAAKEIAGLIPALGGLDALIFTGGIGENAAPVRDNITALLRWAGDFSVYTIPTNEALVIVQACQSLGSAMKKKATSRWENEGGTTK